MKKTALLLLLQLSFGLIMAQNENSILATGNWNKIAVNETGVYKLTYTDLQAMGIDVATINPQNIQIFGNGNGMLPEANSAFRYDDLKENAIQVIGEEDGSFDASDYVLFYGEASTKWIYDETEGMFLHQLNYYSDFTYYFLTASLGNGKRIEEQASSSETPSYTITTFDAYDYHEKEDSNLLKSGKLWLGEYFDETIAYSFDFNFPNRDLSSDVKLKASAYARSGITSNIDINANGVLVGNLSIPSVNMSSATSFYARGSTNSNSFTSPTEAVNVNLSYDQPSSESVAWLDYLTLNARRQLQLSNNQLLFRDIESVGTGNISQFELNNVSNDVKIWDVSDPLNVKEQQSADPISAGIFKFISATDTLKEFVAFENSGFLTPANTSSIANQNLHALVQAEMLIITHPDFVSPANLLANHHINHDGLSTHVVSVDEIYNEFSSGAQDISAIRDFIKMFYDRATSDDEKPKYLLLFGDASYDYKNRISGNTNFVPVFESSNSIKANNTYMSDDFYGYLADFDGSIDNYATYLDIGIGRLPVKTVNEASAVVDKIIHYSTSPNCMGEWRNELSFVADDGDGNIHMDQSDEISGIVSDSSNYLNINKIYLDDFEQVSGSDGDTYPEVNSLLTEKFNEGSLIINYTGHGHPNKLADEYILDSDAIDALNNYNNLPFFYAAACSFGRLDNPELLSGGEKLVLSTEKGAIAGFFATRITYASPNKLLNITFMKNVFENNGDNNYRLGDLQRQSKNAILGTQQLRYSLIGDPALTLTIPEYNIFTTEISNASTNLLTDTLRPFEEINIYGFVGQEDESMLSNFNGTIYYKLFDPSIEDFTLANDAGHQPFVFNRQDHVVYEGSTDVINGEFTINFVVPAGVIFEFGNGKISYYAHSSSQDANGYYDGFVIGEGSTFVEELEIGEVKIYPNITDGLVNIELPEGLNSECHISIFDMTGRQVYSERFDETEQSIRLDLSYFNKGVYLIRTNANKYNFTSKIIRK